MYIHHKYQRALCAMAFVPLLGACSSRSHREWDDSLYAQVVSPRASQSAQQTAAENHAAEGVSDAQALAFSTGDSLNVEDAIRYALENHPSLRQAAYGVRVAAGQEVQARLRPNPAFLFEAEALGSDAGSGGETAYLLEQEFVTAGKLKKAGAVAEADRLMAQASFRGAVFRVATQVRRSFVSVLAAEQRLASERELLTLAGELLEAANARVEAGAATEPDRLRAQVVREQVEIDLQRVEARAAAARRSLATAIGLNGPLGMDLQGDLSALPELPGHEETLARVLDHNAEIERARFAIERARRAHALARAQAVPNLTGSIGPRYSDLDRETTLDVGLGVEVPLFDRNQGGIAAATAHRIAAGASLGAVRLVLIEAVSSAWSAYDSARYAVDKYQTSLLPKAQRTLELTRVAYRAGKTDYLRLLDAQQTYVRSRIAFVDALESLHQSAAIIVGLMQTDSPWLEGDSANSEDSQ